MSDAIDFGDDKKINQRAELVFERQHGFTEDAGPYEYGKIGVSFGGEVFWTGAYVYPGDSIESYNLKVLFAKTIKDRWNKGISTVGVENGND